MDYYGDFLTFLLDNSERIYRFLFIKEVFTPYEMDKKFIDETIYTDISYQDGIIKEVINLENGDYLLGIQYLYDFDDLEREDDLRIEYHLLSKTKITYDKDNHNRYRDYLNYDDDDEDEDSVEEFTSGPLSLEEIDFEDLAKLGGTEPMF